MKITKKVYQKERVDLFFHGKFIHEVVAIYLLIRSCFSCLKFDLISLYRKTSRILLSRSASENEFENIAKRFYLFSLEDRKWCLPKKEFFLALINGCTDFYKYMNLGLSKETVIGYAYDKGYEQAIEDRSVILDYLKKSV